MDEKISCKEIQKTLFFQIKISMEICSSCLVRVTGNEVLFFFYRSRGVNLCHYQDINTKNDIKVARHFNKCPKDKPSLYEGISIYLFYHSCTTPLTQLRVKEMGPRRKKLDAAPIFYRSIGSKSYGLIPVFSSTHQVAYVFYRSIPAFTLLVFHCKVILDQWDTFSAGGLQVSISQSLTVVGFEPISFSLPSGRFPTVPYYCTP